MDKENFTITHFRNVLRVSDKKGQKTEFKQRYSACFIVTSSGLIRFTCAGGTYYADSTHPIFLPQGLSYVNECIEDAESIVFNFYTLDEYNVPETLSAVTEHFTAARFDALTASSSIAPCAKRQARLGELYTLAAKLFSPPENLSSKEIVIRKAEKYMSAHISDPKITVSATAKHCFVSEIYLRKLFRKGARNNPFQGIDRHEDGCGARAGTRKTPRKRDRTVRRIFGCISIQQSI